MHSEPVELAPFDPDVYAFTYDDGRYPVEEWARWHARVLGLRVHLVVVGDRAGELARRLEDEYGVDAWPAPRRDIRFSDPRAYYKALAQLAAPPGLKILLDVDEFLPYRPPAYPRLRRGQAGLVRQLVLWRGEVYDEDPARAPEFEAQVREAAARLGLRLPERLPVARAPMRRIHEGYAPVVGDGGEVGLEPAPYPPLPVLHLQFKGCRDLTLKSWLWVVKGRDHCGSIEELPLKRVDFPYDPRLRDIVGDLPREIQG